MKTWFISDLHLDPQRPETTQQCLTFLEQIKEDAEALYILGDLFDYWIGDDLLNTPLGEPILSIIDAFKLLSNNGCTLYFAHGNRDFLIGEAFMQRIGGQLLDEHHVIDLYGTPTLIMHGDTLCTDDTDYQQLRTLLRNTEWQQAFLAKPLPQRIQEAQQLRAISKEKTEQKQENIMDVNQQQVEAVMQTFGVSQLIHGHTHRPATHTFELAGQTVTRIVLGDWYKQSHYLSFSSRVD
ncbi:MAG: UDP-2,3-diacylglucosamine diphosphatase [Cocleimonas sp.]|nr:UDP-2,3-diacylglucosamine diphosphatase [Cocleimonas sp.]